MQGVQHADADRHVRAQVDDQVVEALFVFVEEGHHEFCGLLDPWRAGQQGLEHFQDGSRQSSVRGLGLFQLGENVGRLQVAFLSEPGGQTGC
ncbi:hypothetical protein AB0E25_40060 [Streptomyces bobili]|uniref:hypothetical protein n=1 Tax=Streptomyces bobili TaxID=67280 RepID=UPI0033C16CE1